jgi:hypothetical protein
MKHLLSFLAGSSVTTAAVVLAGGYHAGMVILGGILSLTTLLVIGRALGIPRVCRWLLALHNANSAVRSANAGKRVTVIDRREEHQRQNHSQTRRKVVPSSKPEMLRPIQQDVVSALANLGMPIVKAERIVLECAKPGDSFDDLFKRAVVSVPRKTA